MATITAAKAQSTYPARFLHEGVVHEISTITADASLSVGDVVQMMKVPQGAVVFDYQIKQVTSHGATGTGSMALAVGDGLTDDRYGSADMGSVQAVFALTTSPNYQYSAADTIDISVTEVSDLETAAAILQLSVLYSCDKAKDDAWDGGTTAGG